MPLSDATLKMYIPEIKRFLNSYKKNPRKIKVNSVINYFGDYKRTLKPRTKHAHA